MRETHQVAIAGSGIVSDVIDGECIIMDLTTGNYFSLLGAGVMAWPLLSAGMNFPDVAERVAGAFGVTASSISGDLQDLVSELLEYGLLVETDEAPAGLPIIQVTLADMPYSKPVLTLHADMSDMLAIDPPLPFNLP